MIKRGLLVVFSGPSGVGKDTLLKAFMPTRDDCALSISATTRSIRPGEVDGVHYRFISPEKFSRLIDRGQMLEYAQYSGNYYGTPKEPVEQLLAAGKNVILEIETVGAMKIREMCPDAVFVFLVPPSMQALRRRLEGRGTEDGASVQRRMRLADAEMALARQYDYVIVNNTVEESCKKLDAIITAAGCAASRMQDYIREVNENA